MTVSKAAQSRKTAIRKETTLRHVWLASLGAVAVARKEVVDAAGAATTRFAQARAQAVSFAVDARDVAWGGLLTLRERAEPAFEAFASGLGARLQPALATVGMASGSVRRVSRPTVRKAKPAGRRGGRSRA